MRIGLSSENAGVNQAPTDRAPAVTHYENFPVASLLCPPRLRPPIAAIYWFARTADDIADEGDATPELRLATLAAYRSALRQAAAGAPDPAAWPGVFVPLARAVQEFALPLRLLHDLLDAFEQDVRQTRDGAGYADRAQLRDYCRRSAEPVGRLLLHLYAVQDAEALARSDALCSALQLINFWQDLRRDTERGRYYLPAADCTAHGLARADWLALRQTPAATRLLADLVAWARALMAEGAPLVHRVPGRAGWELRLVVQGGLRILDKIEAMDYATLRRRPRLRAWDAPRMAWRALRM